LQVTNSSRKRPPITPQPTYEDKIEKYQKFRNTEIGLTGKSKYIPRKAKFGKWAALPEKANEAK
jgi:hypothetical protein